MTFKEEMSRRSRTPVRSAWTVLQPHLAFGAHLAKLQIGAVMREWHRQIPEYAITEGFELSYTPGLRSVFSLPLQFPASAKD